MTKGKIAQWSIMFLTLTAFTYTGVVSTFFQTRSLYAEAKEQGMISGDEVLFIDQNGGGSEDRLLDDRGPRLQRLFSLIRHDKLCAVTSDQARDIASMYPSSLHQVEIKDTDRTVTLFRVLGGQDEKAVIFSLLEETNPDIDCRIVKHNNFLYLLFSAHLS